MKELSQNTMLKINLHATSFLACVVFTLSSARAETILVATATNFHHAMEKLEADFENTTGHEVKIVSGSTGKLYAQISQCAPFDVFLAADQARPKRLEQNGAAVSGSRFTYAIGLLSLWSPTSDLIPDNEGEAFLASTKFRRLAIANPNLAPYGAAAIDVMNALNVTEVLETKIVMGENIGQAHALVASGNAEVGFVALSHVLSKQNKVSGSRWDPPETLYSPIYQDAVLLSRSANNAAAIEFMSYLKSDEARAIISNFGYRTEP